MKSKLAREDSLEPECTWMVFECFSSDDKDEEQRQQQQQQQQQQQYNTRRGASTDGVEREMRIMYQQPHLVPPMRLTKFEDLPPPTPPPTQSSHLAHWMAHGKASVRASLSVRRPGSARPSISSPRPPLPVEGRSPARKAQEFRPLELSIYMPRNRLSDLPEFDCVSFTDGGEIKLPPRALVRTRSEEFLSSSAKAPLPFAAPKPASMIEQRRRMSHFHAAAHAPDTSSTVISISRPPSEYDALHSHPVSWMSLPGLPPSVHVPGVRSESGVQILTPMQEEFTPPATAVTIDGVLLEFPKEPSTRGNTHHDASVTELEPILAAAKASAAAPAPDVPLAAHHARNFSRPPASAPAETVPVECQTKNYFHPNYHTQQRISQWLAHRHSTSTSTIKTTTSTTSSFAEHRRKRSEFYQLGRRTQPAPAPAPKTLSLWPKNHRRTVTASTVASTVASDILSLDSDAHSQADTSVTTPLASRSGTVKSGVIKGGALRPIVSGVPDVPPCYAEVIAQAAAADAYLIKEIGGPLRSPGVGVAF